MKKLLCFDLDGTLTQHRSKLEDLRHQGQRRGPHVECGAVPVVRRHRQPCGE